MKVGKLCNSYSHQQFFLECLKVQKSKQKPLFFNWDSLHARLNSRYKAYSHKKKKNKKIKA